MRRTFAVLGVAVLGMTACDSDPRSGPSAPPPVSPPAAVSPKGAVLENFVGTNLGDAQRALEELGLKHKAESEDGKLVIDPANWTVDEQEPKAGTEVEAGSTVKLTVSR